MNRPTEQIYSNYTPQDFEVWKTLYNRQMQKLKGNVCDEYMQAIEVVNFNENEIPDFVDVNKRLAAATGWGLHVVPNISPAVEFFTWLSKEKFTATCWLRTMEQLDYIEEPDMFHDVFAHVPLLSNYEYANFFSGISQIALKHIDKPDVLEKIGRLYWFTIEFGMMKNPEADDYKIYGAGIISSAGETRHCLDNSVPKIPFDIETIFNTPYRTDVLQEKYFYIESFTQLYISLGEVERRL